MSMKFEFKEVGEVVGVSFLDLPLGMFKKIHKGETTIGYKLGSSTILFHENEILFVTVLTDRNEEIFFPIPYSRVIVLELLGEPI